MNHLYTAILLSLFFISYTCFANENIFIDEYPDDYICLIAKQDARTYHGNTEIFFALGFFTGPVGLALTSLKEVDISKKCFYKSNNQSFFNNNVYVSCYKKTAKKTLMKYCVFGWFISLLLMIILLIMVSKYN